MVNAGRSSQNHSGTRQERTSMATLHTGGGTMGGQQGLVADNSFMVPYNRQLLLKYRAHINVEACATAKSVKYLFKYVYKGHDCANMEMVTEDGEARDEIKTYLNCRYYNNTIAI
jgi:hypothetical protein